MKKIFLFVCLALVIAVILFFSIPVPIVSHPDSSKIGWIMVNPDFGNPDSIPLDISISDDVEQEILEYLHQCTMRRITVQKNSVSLSPRNAVFLLCLRSSFPA